MAILQEIREFSAELPHWQKVALENASVTLGRGLESDIRLKDIKASRRHCQIAKAGAGFQLLDLSRLDADSVTYADRVTSIAYKESIAKARQALLATLDGDPRVARPEESEVVVTACSATMPGCRSSSSPAPSNIASQIDCGEEPLLIRSTALSQASLSLPSRRAASIAAVASLSILPARHPPSSFFASS